MGYSLIGQSASTIQEFTASVTYSSSGNNDWTPLGAATGTAGTDTQWSSTYNQDDDLIYMMPVGGSGQMYSFNPTNNAYSTVSSALGNSGTQSIAYVKLSDGSKRVYNLYAGNTLYHTPASGGSWTQVQGPTWTCWYASLLNYKNRFLFVLGDGNTTSARLQRYSISGNNWEQMANCPENIYASEGVVIKNNIYFVHQSTDSLYRYSVLENSWKLMIVFSASIGTIYAIGAVGDDLYVSGSGGFYRYNTIDEVLVSSSLGYGPGYNFVGYGKYITRNNEIYEMKGYVTNTYAGVTGGTYYDRMWKYSPVVSQPSILFTASKPGIARSLVNEIQLNNTTTGQIDYEIAYSTGDVIRPYGDKTRANETFTMKWVTM